MTSRQQEFRHFGTDVQWLDAAEALAAYDRAIRFSSNQHYGLSRHKVVGIKQYPVNADSRSAAPWLAEAVRDADRLTIIFGPNDVCRTSGDFLVREWPNLFCPGRDDLIILPDAGDRVLFYHHEDLFEVGRRRINEQRVHHLSVEIARFVDDHQPGFVACEFKDADGRVQTVVDKVPIFTNEHLDVDSRYPQPSNAACIVLWRWRDAAGRDLARISTEKPCGIETPQGISEFVVLASQLTAKGT